MRARARGTPGTGFPGLPERNITMTEDTKPGRNGIDMIGEPVEPSPGTGDDDNEIGEPFWVEHRTEEGVKTTHLRIVRVCDDSMEPELREGEWVVVDLASRRPEAGGKFLIRLGERLVARRAEAMPGDGAEDERLRFIPANPACAPCFAEDVEVLGEVEWEVKRP